MRNLLATTILGILILTGCAKGDKLVGTWIAERPMQDNTETFILELTADKRADLRNTLAMPGAGSMTIRATGTYTAKSGSDSFTPAFTEVTLDAPDLQDRQESAKQAISRRFNKEFKPKWISSDEFEIHVGGSAALFKRQPK